VNDGYVIITKLISLPNVCAVLQYSRQVTRGVAFELAVLCLLQVSEVTRFQQETAIGYISGDDGKLHLAPGPQERHIFYEHSRVVVIAESD